MGSSSFHSIPLFWMSCHKPAWREKCLNVLVDGGDKEKGNDSKFIFMSGGPTYHLRVYCLQESDLY